MTLPRPIPMLLSVLGVLVLVSALVGLGLALTQKPPAWFFLSFELVVVMGAVFLVLLGKGKFKEGPAITLLCCAGAIGVSALLGWQATGRQINGHSVTWLLLIRLLAAGLLVLAAAADVVIRDPRRILPRIGWGLALAAPLLVLLALFQMGTLGSAIAKLSGGSKSFGFGIWMIVGLIGGALLSASGHLLITGFQIGVRGAAKTLAPPAPPTKTPPAPPAPPLQTKPSSPAPAQPATQPAPTGTPSGTQA